MAAWSGSRFVPIRDEGFPATRTDQRDLRELRALGPLGDRQSHSVQQNGQVTCRNANHKDDPGFWIE
jgi:hypothetical protein